MFSMIRLGVNRTTSIMCVNKSAAAFSLQDEVFGYNCPAAAAAGCSHLYPSQQLSQVLISFVILLNIRLISQTSYDVNDFPRSLSILYTRADLRGGGKLGKRGIHKNN